MIVVLDLEWNQPTIPKKRVPGLDGEIIQIGAALIDGDMEIKDTFEAVIKPVYYTKMNKDISELTLIKTEDLQNGIPFAEAMEKFRAFCGEDCVYVTWSRSDLYMLINNCKKFNVEYEPLPQCYDAQLMFDDMEMQEGKSFALNYALYHFNEKPSGAHNALSDVYSTIAVMRHLDIAEALTDDYFRYDNLINIKG